MPRYKLTIEYDGTPFVGWQAQDNGVSVQAVLSEAIAAFVDRLRHGGGRCVVACSALKRRYRDVLIGDRRDVRLVYLKGEEALIFTRIAARRQHFMPAQLLHSQFLALEEPGPEENPITVSVVPEPDAIVTAIVAELGGRGAPAPPAPAR